MDWGVHRLFSMYFLFIYSFIALLLTLLIMGVISSKVWGFRSRISTQACWKLSSYLPKKGCRELLTLDSSKVIPVTLPDQTHGEKEKLKNLKQSKRRGKWTNAFWR
jgi:hypothetical protein